MEAKDYQEIINTADCNAEVNFVDARGNLQVLGWAKRLIEEAHKEGQREMVKYLSDGSLCEHKVSKKSCARCWYKKLVELGLEKE